MKEKCVGPAGIKENIMAQHVIVTPGYGRDASEWSLLERYDESKPIKALIISSRYIRK